MSPSEHFDNPVPFKINPLAEKRLQEKERLLQNLQSQYHDLGKCPAAAARASAGRPLIPCSRVSEFPSQSASEADPEVRKSRAAVIATEPIPETVEITRTRVKKNSRSVIIADAP